MVTKDCTKCGVSKELTEFYKSRPTFDGYHSQCKICHNAQVKRYANKNKDVVAAIGKRWHDKNKERVAAQIRAKKFQDPAHHLVLRAKARAKEKNIPFSITGADISIPSHCPVLGIPLIIGKGKRTPNSPSLDRLIPEKGYTKGNVTVISWRANVLKRDGTAEELRAIADWMDNQK